MADEIKTEEANAAKSPGGRLILGAICAQANAVSSHAMALQDSCYYGMGGMGMGDPDEGTPTDIPEAEMELVSAMKDSVKNLSGMVNMFYRAEAASSTAPASESFVVSESGDQITAVFSEAGTAQVTKGEVSGTMIVSGMNANRNRFYTEEALRDAADRGLWDGKPMYLNHQTESEKRDSSVRSVKDLAAIIKETKYDPGSKSIKYRAQLADPGLEDKLTYMQEHGILSGLGVSIHASGQGRKETMESTPTFVVERFLEAYSTDFVTAPGAGGSIDVLESATEQEKPNETAIAGENTMDEKALQALLDQVKGIVTAAVAPIAESQAKSEARIAAVEAQGKAKTMIEASDLPKAAKDSLALQFSEAKTTDGVDDAIKAMQTLVEALKPEVKKGTDVKEAGKSQVRGLGANVEESVGKKATVEDFVNSPAIALLGGKEKGQKLLESLR